MKRKTVIALSVLFLLFLIGCASKMVATMEFGSIANCSSRLLIASQDSDFKNAIVKKVSEGLVQDYCYVKQVDVSSLPDEQSDLFTAVAILNAMKMMSLDGTVKDFIKAEPNKEKVVVLVTTGREKTIEMADVDAISSASKLKKTDSVADTMISKLRGLANNQ